MILIRAGGHRCAVPLANVSEVMRILPIKPIAGAAVYVRGISVVRGQSIPVIDLGVLLGNAAADDGGRLIVLRVNERNVAMAVDAIGGLATLSPSMLSEIPPLLHDACAEFLAGIGVLDGELLMVLQASRIITDKTWSAVASQAAST